MCLAAQVLAQTAQAMGSATWLLKLATAILAGLVLAARSPCALAPHNAQAVASATVPSILQFALVVPTTGWVQSATFLASMVHSSQWTVKLASATHQRAFLVPTAMWSATTMANVKMVLASAILAGGAPCALERVALVLALTAQHTAHAREMISCATATRDGLETVARFLTATVLIATGAAHATALTLILLNAATARKVGWVQLAIALASMATRFLWTAACAHAILALQALRATLSAALKASVVASLATRAPTAHSSTAPTTALAMVSATTTMPPPRPCALATLALVVQTARNLSAQAIQCARIKVPVFFCLAILLLLAHATLVPHLAALASCVPQHTMVPTARSAPWLLSVVAFLCLSLYLFPHSTSNSTPITTLPATITISWHGLWHCRAAARMCLPIQP